MTAGDARHYEDQGGTGNNTDGSPSWKSQDFAGVDFATSCGSHAVTSRR